jgi:hypothetical protein
MRTGPDPDTLARAAEAAVAEGIELDEFMSAAWNAYLDARPGVRAALEEAHVRAQLEALRRRGLVGEA